MSATPPTQDRQDWQARAQAGLQALRRSEPEAAAAALAEAHEARPGHPGIAAALAAAHNELGQPEAALAVLAHVAEAARDVADWHQQQGAALDQLGRDSEAEAAYGRAVALDPTDLTGRHKLAQAQARQDKFAAAEATYRAALAQADATGASREETARLWHNLARILRDAARIGEAIGCFQAAIECQGDLEPAHAQLLLALHYDPDRDKAELYRAHRAWRDRFCAELEATAQPPPVGPADKAPLTVGILAGELRRHPQLWLYLAAFENLAPSAVRLVVYDYSSQHDDFTQLLAARAALWRDVQALDDAALAAQMRADGLDILINKAGHAEGRLAVCARRPAPVQVQWGGFNTSGLDTMDWFLGDWVELPPGEDAYFTESLYRLPDGYVVYRPPHSAPPVGPLPRQATGRVTFGCFNHPAKLNSQTAALWAEILHRVPESRLFLKGKAFAEADVARPLSERLAAAGVPLDRLVLEGRSPHPKLLASYNHVDMALDPWPYSGGLTTIEAMWMGVPTVTLPGPSFVGRHAASHLTNAGLADWIAADGADYVAKAVAWAHAPAELAQLRARLRGQVAASPLCDGPRFARNLEAALRDMWQRQARAEAPSAIARR